VRTFKALMQFVLATTQRRRLLVPVPFALMKLQAMFLQFLPRPPITPDQVELLKRDNIVSDEAKRDSRTLEAIGITPESIEAIVPTYLWRFRKTGQFNPHVA
jgi:NADH dehydrogenase